MEKAFERARAAYGTGAYDDATMEFLFPQLKESEDERIRKFLVKHVSEWIGCIKHDLKLSSKDVESEEELAMFEAGLAYLEKQKDLDKMIVVSPEVWDKAINDAYENGKKDNEKQKEQKPAEWSDEDKCHLASIIGCIELCKKDTEDAASVLGYYDSDIDWLKSLRPQQKVEWSEEDELMRTVIIMTLETFGGRGNTEMQIDWLKALPERFSYQTK